ncbi:MAG: hypothetical protein QW757_02230 [Candidatus Woesearchaeota archaeon]
MAINIIAYIVRFFIRFSIKLVKYFSRHGKTPLKFLFWVDDIIRLFTMTIIFYLLAIIFKLSTFWTIVLFILGLIVDFHDFVSQSSIGKFDLN